MPSLVPGYEYDIFISYRQKDNKYDGWVTEFVSNLKKELEATFKENISIYFDENPHDGLLETHDVDESLKDKLKCLIFIPIISQTYCDPKSFAWSHEFLPFKKLASEDRLGLKLRLSNGNVASRILPICIHELDDSDKLLLENEIGLIRSIDFIHKDLGVNRPLRAKDDETKFYAHSTYYRDQINKVANSVKGLIGSLGNNFDVVQPKSTVYNPNARKPNPFSNIRWAKVWIPSVILAIVGFLYIISLSKYGIIWQKDTSSHSLKTSIAVLPFVLNSDNSEAQYFADGIMQVIHANISMLSDFRVVSVTSVEKYRKSEKLIREIGSELGVDYIMEGVAQKYNEDIQVIVKLINVKSDETIWVKEYNGYFGEVFKLQSQISLQVANELKAHFTKYQLEQILKVPTHSLEGYDYFLQARKIIMNPYAEIKEVKHAIGLFKRAIQLDSTFAFAFTELGYALMLRDGERVNKDSVFFYFDKALKLDPNLAMANSNMAAYYFTFEGDFHEFDKKMERAKPYLDRAMLYNPNDPFPPAQLATFYFIKGDLIPALKYSLEALVLSSDQEEFTEYLYGVGAAYHGLGELNIVQAIYEFLPETDMRFLNFKYDVNMSLKHYDQALAIASKYKGFDSLWMKAYVYYRKKDFDKALKYYEHYYSAMPLNRRGNMGYIFTLAKTGNKSKFDSLLKIIENVNLSNPLFYFLKDDNETALKKLEQQNLNWEILQTYMQSPMMYELSRNDKRFELVLSAKLDSLADIRKRAYQMKKSGMIPDLEMIVKERGVTLNLNYKILN